VSKIATATWTGQSGTDYNFTVYPIGTSFRAVGAVYIFTKRTVSDGTASHKFIYIGQTDDLSTRFDNHHKANCIARNGANCISVHMEDSEDQRLAIETDLCRLHDTPCNG
jgi:predicted GIY-YIG superfamily endonuclease